MQFELDDLGIQHTLNIVGHLDILQVIEGPPIVFLIDEKHHDQSIKINVLNARELIKFASVEVIGVESHEGGFEWDESDETYYEEFNDGNINNQQTNTCPEFANSLKELLITNIYGVECRGMLNKIECDLFDQSLFDANSIVNHPLQLGRSKHFIQTLFGHKIRNNKKGNLLLNCGSNHNSHIEQWIKSGEINAITNHPASYIRLNAFK
ncbi:hypothetical protein WG954_03905 [Lacibacter sp. H375]|uniref:hypothetical protein n=1 Tax=Lacibacter sp. H375 TaxID=3133424 RepID=UPI0030C644A9